MSVLKTLTNDQLAMFAGMARSDAAEYGKTAAAAERQAATCRERERESIRHAEHAERLLAWRQRTGAASGDVFADLEALEQRLQHGILRSIQQDAATGQGIAFFTDREGQGYRIVFSGGVTAFDIDNSYAELPDGEIVNAQVAGALWDENWLVEATLNGRSLHVRFDGDIDRIDPLGPHHPATPSR